MSELEIKQQKMTRDLAQELAAAKSDKQTAKRFALEMQDDTIPRKKAEKAALEYLRHGNDSKFFQLIPEEKELINDIRNRIYDKETKKLEEKKDDFSTGERLKLLAETKAGYPLYGLKKDDINGIFRRIGFTEEDINKITGKKLLATEILSESLAWSGNVAKVYSTAHPEVFPFLSQLPNDPNVLIGALGISLAAYFGAFAWNTQENFKATKKWGASTSTFVTGTYFLADKFVPDKTRDLASRAYVIAQNGITDAGMYTAATIALFHDPRHAIAATLASTLFSAALGAGLNISMKVDSVKEKMKKKKDLKIIEKTTSEQSSRSGMNKEEKIIFEGKIPAKAQQD